MSAIIKALAALVRASHNYDEVEEQTADHWRALASAARNEYETARAKLTKLCDVEPRRSLLQLCDDAELEVGCEWEQRRAAEEELDELRAEIERLRSALEAQDKILTTLRVLIANHEARMGGHESQELSLISLGAAVVMLRDRVVCAALSAAERKDEAK